MSYRSVYCTTASHARAHLVMHRLNEIEFPHAETSVLFLDLDKAATSAASLEKPTPKNARPNKLTTSAYPELGETTVTQTIIVPAVGSLVAVGPVAAILNDAATYGIAGGLREFGVPESEASRYEARLKEGHVFLAIRTENPDKSDLVRGIFAAEGAEDIRTLMHVLTPKTSRRSLYGGARLSVG
jgi:hypothetical protein